MSRSCIVAREARGWRGWCLVLLAVSWAAMPEGALAGSVTANIDTGFQSASLGGGKSTYYAYSVQTEKLALGPNDSTSFNTIKDDFNFQHKIPVVDGAKIKKSNGLFARATTYEPVVGFKNRDKPGADVRLEELASVSGDYQGRAGQVTPRNGEKGFLTAKGTSTAIKGFPSAGSAAGYSEDPFDVGPGVYSYNQEIDMELDLTDDESGGATVFGLDGRFTDIETFDSRGNPYEEALWALNIYGAGPLLDYDSLVVELYINPLARSLGVFDPALSDSQIEAQVIAALTLEDGVARLTDYMLFPSGTTLQVRPEDGIISFGMGAAADITVERVPEPPASTLALVAVCGALAVAWKGRGNKRRG